MPFTLPLTVLFLPLNYNWSEFNVNFHYKNSTKKESIYQIRGIQMSSSLVPNKFYDLTKDTFALNPAENEIWLQNPNKLINSLTYLQKQGAIRFSFLVDLALDKGSIYVQPHIIDVYLTQFTINGTISSSSIGSKADLAQTSLRFSSVTNAGLIFEVACDSAGRFETEPLPIGTYYFEAI